LLRNFHMKKFSWRKQENPRSVDNTTMLGDSAFGAVQSLELSGVVMVKKFLVKYAENQGKAITAIWFKFEFRYSILNLDIRIVYS